MAQPRYWTAATTRLHQEERAAHHVENQGFEFYLPRTWEPLARPIGPITERRALLFPGWIFIKLRPNWQVLPSTRGIKSLMTIDGKPCHVRDSEIASLRAMEDCRGVIRLPDRFTKGDRVVVGQGGKAWRDHWGIVYGTPAAGRCQVLFKLLGRRVVVELREAILSPA
jgi:transcription antitermination factor NusG